MANEGKAEKRRENSNTEILKTGEQPFRPSLAASLIIVGYLIISMAAAIFYLDQKLHVTMLTAFGVAVLVLTIEKCPYSKVEEAILEGSKLAVPTILILYSIGCLMGAWIASGTVPMIIYWGLKLINPSIHLSGDSLSGLCDYLPGHGKFLVNHWNGRRGADRRRNGTRDQSGYDRRRNCERSGFRR